MLVRDVKLEGGRQRHPSGGVSAKEMVIGLEGVELGADGKVRKQRRANEHPRIWTSEVLLLFLYLSASNEDIHANKSAGKVPRVIDS